MKKSITFGLLSASMALMMVGCGNADDKYAKLAELGDYKNVTVDVSYYEVIEDEVTKYAEQELASMIESYDLYNYEPIKDAETVKSGDIVNIDYLGKKDGVAFDGGTSQGYHLEIGSGTFIDGFEDGLVGAKVGECLDLPLTFPEDYYSEDLAGQDVIFTVSVNSIDEKTSPEYNEDLFATIGMTDISDYDGYVDYVRDYVTESVAKQNDEILENAIIEKILEVCKVSEDVVPAELVEEKKSEIDADYAAYAEYYGIDKETLISYMGAEDGQTYDDVISESAKEEAKNELVYRAIVAAENIDLSDEALREFAEAEYESLGFESADALMESREGDYFKSYVRREKVIDLVKQTVKVNEGDKVSALADYIY